MKVEKVIDMINKLNNSDFTGFIRINYMQGGITKVEIKKCI